METTLDYGDLKLDEHSEEWEYKPGRKVRRGELIRLRGGPVYIDGAGNKHALGETGKVKFLEYCRVTCRGKLVEDYILVSGDCGGSVVVVITPRYKKSPYGLKIQYKGYRVSRLRVQA